MANPSTTTPSPASRRFVDQATRWNTDLLALWAANAATSLQTTVDLQKATLATSQTVYDASVALSQDALTRWADLARQAQAASLANIKEGTKLLQSLPAEA